MSSYVFKLPDLGEGVVEGEIVAWHVKVGDQVREDDPIVDVITDKATVTIPSVVDGRVIATRGDVGQSVPVGSDLVRFEVEEQGHETSATDGLVGQAEAVAVGTVASAGRLEADQAPGAAPPPSAPATRPLASPAVRRRAREKGVDLSLLKGSGRGGRVTDADIENYLRSAAGAPQALGRVKRTGTTEIHLAGLRRRVAEKMSVSHAHIPHYSYFEEVDITELEALRQHLNDRRSSDEPKLTYLPFIMLAVARAFAKYPAANAHYDHKREVVTRYEAVHLGIATHTERGLYVPVVRHVEAMDLREAARELRRVTRAAHHNTIRREELIGSTFTVTSLGRLGGLAATPIINHPEVGILGVHSARQRPVVRDGAVAVRHMVNLSSSFDHRVVDGMDGVQLIQTLKDYLEHPALIFLE